MVLFHKKAKKSEPRVYCSERPRAKFTVKAFKFWGFLNIGHTQFFHMEFEALYPGKTHITQFCRIKVCGGAGCPPTIIFERLKLPQQIIYRRKGNLSESPNH